MIRTFAWETIYGWLAALPLNLDKGKRMHLIVDIAQIVGQFGIAIAAANTVIGQ